MKIKKNLTKILSAFLVLACVLGFAPNITADAASEYTVTIRPGNIGAGAAEKITVAKGTLMADVLAGKNLAATALKEENKGVYFASGYSYDDQLLEAGAVVRNIDVVVDYGKLINGVEYQFRFVEAGTENEVAPTVVAYGNIGDRFSWAPEAVAGYTLVSQPFSGLLDDEAANNIITFNYSSTATAPADQITDVNVIGAGTTQNEVVDVTVPGAPPVAVVPPVAPPVPPVDALPIETPPLAPPDDGNLENIEDGDTPQGNFDGDEGGNSDQAGDIDSLDDDPTALANFDNGASGVWWIILVAVAGGAAIAFLAYKKKKASVEVDDEM